MTLLEIQALSIDIKGTRPVRGLSLSVGEGETVGVVGETGCGKTLTGLSVLGMLPVGAKVTGSVRLDGRELVGAAAKVWRDVRGGKAAMVFQNPGTAFDPVRTIGAQFVRVIRRHRQVAKSQALHEARALLSEVELADPERVLTSYPHQLSGGMLQRAMFALALSCRPRLLIADEATSALDVTVAQQVRRLLLRLQARHGFGVMFITHNLGEAYDLCDRVYVLYAGEVAETGPAGRVFGHARHPYTQALLAAMPKVNDGAGTLTALAGTVPTNVLEVTGCVFANRCPRAQEICRDARPPFDGSVACHFPEPLP